MHFVLLHDLVSRPKRANLVDLIPSAHVVHMSVTPLEQSPLTLNTEGVDEGQLLVHILLGPMIGPVVKEAHLG
jgi:hypothetical protein